MALVVIVTHCAGMAGLDAQQFPAPLRFLTWGEMAVQVFVILSGFVIFMLLDREAAPYRQYIWRRFFRLFPVYIITLLCGLIISRYAIEILQGLPWQGDAQQALVSDYRNANAHFGAHLFWHLTMLHGIWPDEVLPSSGTAFIGPAWSVSLEWQFYLIAPLIVWLIRKRPKGVWIFLPIIIIGVMANERTGGFMRTGRHLTYPLKSFLPLMTHFFFIGISSYYLFSWLERRKLRVPGAVLMIALTVALLFLPPPIILWVVVLISCLYSDAKDKPLLAKVVSWATTKSSCR